MKLGDVLQARQVKSGEPYSFTVGSQHAKVVRFLDENPGATDSDITFGLRLHMAAPRRCELRDAGLVEQAGRRDGAMTWQLTKAGRDLFAGLTEVAA